MSSLDKHPPDPYGGAPDCRRFHGWLLSELSLMVGCGEHAEPKFLAGIWSLLSKPQSHWTAVTEFVTRASKEGPSRMKEAAHEGVTIEIRAAVREGMDFRLPCEHP